MLDIPMLQPSTKVTSSGDTSTKESPRSRESDSSEADFDATYTSEAEDEATRADKEKSDLAADDSEEKSTVKSDASADETANPDALPEEEQQDGKLAAVTADDHLSKKDTVQKSNVGATELAFAQRLALTQEERTAKSTEVGNETKSIPGTQQVGDEDVVKIASATAQEKRPAENLPLGDKRADKASLQADRQADLNVPKAAQVAASAQTQTGSQAQMDVSPNAGRKSDDVAKRDAEAQVKPAVEVSARTDQKSKLASPTAVSSMASATSPSLTQVAAAQDAGNPDIPLVINGDVEAATNWDSRATTPASLAQTLARPETPGMIGRQMAEVLQRLPDRPVELALNPEELGRVRLSISAAESGITVSVLAERPETLDLMRRHIDQLAREFQALGYTNINFAFNEGQSEHGENHGEAGNPRGDTHPITSSDAVPETASPIKLGATTGVDLRL